jgi:hypothetical protein
VLIRPEERTGRLWLLAAPGATDLAHP